MVEGYDRTPAIIDAAENGEPSDVMLQLLLGYDPRDKQSFQEYLEKQIDDSIDWFGRRADDAATAAKSAVWLLSKIAGALANVVKAVAAMQTRKKIKDVYYTTLGIQKDVALANRILDQINIRLVDCCTAMQTQLAVISSKVNDIASPKRVPNVGTETPKRGFPSLP